MRFHFALHDHQPYGNHEEVFRRGWDQCYGPSFEVLESHPKTKFSLHLTGALWLFIEDHHPKAMDRLRSMASSGQMEVIGGAFYEPVLAMISRRDAIGQIERLRSYVRSRLGVDPVGLWLAERVWQPDLPELTEEAGIDFLLLDDTHLQTAGPDLDSPIDYAVAESRGCAVSVFPIDQALRYAIPFEEPSKTVERLHIMHTRGHRCATYADDGEKFGMWPDTTEWIWRERWLDRFLETLASAPWIETCHFQETLAAMPPTHRVYPPTTSYAELGEWALPPKRQAQRKAVLESITASCGDETGKSLQPYLRGGHFNVFLARYFEADWMRARSMELSRRIADAEEQADRTFGDLREALYRSQVNCPYWHGLFGGLYIPALREAVWRQILLGESLLAAHGFPQPRLAGRDRDFDGYDEFVGGDGPGRFAVLSRWSGGLAEWSRWDVEDAPLNVLSRHLEAYHLASEEHESDESKNGDDRYPRSIHDRRDRMPQAWREQAGWDGAPRLSGVELCLPQDLSLDALRRDGSLRDRFYRPARVRCEETSFEIETALEKSTFRRLVTFENSACSAVFRHEVSHLDVREIFAVEWNIAVPDGFELRADDVDVFSAAKDAPAWDGPYSAHRVSCVRGSERCRIDWHFSSEVELWAYPVETIVRSERGFEMIRQGLCCIFRAAKAQTVIEARVDLLSPPGRK